MATGARDARLNFRLPTDLKEVIEDAAATLGQSVSDFAVNTLVRQARTVIEQGTRGPERCNWRGIRFIAPSGTTCREARPNPAAPKAAKRYKKQLG